MSIKLRIMSDLHLEKDLGWMLPVMDGEIDQVLILAGDIVPFSMLYKIMPFFEDLSRRFKKVIYVPGNHEYYGGDVSKSKQLATYKLSKLRNIKVLDNEHIVIDGVYIFGATLWTDLNGAILEQVYSKADYRNIHIGRRNLTPARTMWENQYSTDLIKKFNKAEVGAKKVLVTHHPVSYDFCSPRWANAESNPMFYNEMDWDDLSNFSVIVSGHTHDSVHIDKGATQGYINPRGYPSEIFMGAAFNPFLVVEVD